jgi:ATP-binding cassette subfamily B protein
MIILTTKISYLLAALWAHLSLKRRRQLYFVAWLTLISSISEIVFLIAIVPFIAIITVPEKVINSHYLQSLHFVSKNELLLPLTIFFAICALSSGLMRLILIKTSLKIANATGTDLSIDMYRKTLAQPYKIHIVRNSSDIISAIAQKSIATTTVIVSIVTFITTSALFIAIVIAMLIINTKVTVLSAGIIGFAYLTIAKFTKKNLAENGKIIAERHNDVMQTLQEGLGAIRDILIDGTQETYIKVYAKAANELQKSRAENMFISQSPRYIIETFSMMLIAVFILITNSRHQNIIEILPILGFFALSAQRLLPLIQQMYGYWSEIIGNKAALAEVINILNEPSLADNSHLMPINFQKEIKLKDIKFQYSPNSKIILNQINITIPRGARVGIVGRTGSGKSTLLDIIMGLIEPSAGQIMIDNILIDSSNNRAWQKLIAHVPQSIFLTNASIAENIAFGVPKEAINMENVIKAAIKARAHEFILECTEGYATFVGERGIRLSGGQRQRIGIARALYKNAKVLCLDEATSALDDTTELNVMDTIDNLGDDLTIFIIAHRLSTLKNCSYFIELS